MKKHYYRGNKIIEYCTNDFVGFYFNEDMDIMTTRGNSLEQVKRDLDRYDPVPGSRMS
jgi:hypothetical protein